MTIEEAIYAYATASPLPVSALGTRWYNEEAPQQANVPHCVYQRVSPVPLMTQSGDPTLMKRYFQFSFVSGSQSAAKSYADAFRRAVNGYVGTWGTVAIKGVMWAGEAVLKLEALNQWQVSQTYGIWYVEE